MAPKGPHTRTHRGSIISKIQLARHLPSPTPALLLRTGPGRQFPVLGRAASDPSHLNFILRQTTKPQNQPPAGRIVVPDALGARRSLPVALFARCLREVLFWMTRNRIRLHPKRRCHVARQLRLAGRS